jgi:hypothetical protein
MAAHNFRERMKAEEMAKEGKHGGMPLRLEIEPTMGGGHAVTARFRGKGGEVDPEERKEFGPGEGGAALGHIAQHMGIPCEVEQGEPGEEDE